MLTILSATFFALVLGVFLVRLDRMLARQTRRNCELMIERRELLTSCRLSGSPDQCETRREP